MLFRSRLAPSMLKQQPSSASGRGFCRVISAANFRFSLGSPRICQTGKCLEANVNSSLFDTLNPLQLAFRPGKSMDDAIALAVHTALSHLDKGDTCEDAVLIVITV